MSNSSSTKKTKWTILFIVHAVVEDTRVYAEKLFAELLEANIDPDKVQVFVLHDTYDYVDASQVHATLYEIKRNEKENGDSTYEPKENAGYSNIRCPYDLGSISITDEEGLKQVIEEVEKRIESADNGKNITRKRILVTWDHSNGFGFFDNSQTDLGIQIKKSSRRPDMLMVTELEKALKNCVPNGKIEILIMMHCWMQNIEAAYQLKDVVKILIGAETVFDFQGYDFTNLVNSISASASEIDEEKLAQQILDDIPKKLVKIEHRPSEEIFVSATRPEHSGLIKEQIDLLAGALREELLKPGENLRKILEARASCFEITKVADGYTPWYFVDIFEAIKKLESQNLVPDVIKQISYAIDEAYKQYIINVAHLPSGEEPPADFENFKGVSICFPYQNDTFTIGTIYTTYYSVNSDDPKKIDFAKDSAWPRFLDDLLTEVRNAVRKKADKLEANPPKRKSPPVDEIVNKILSPVVKRQNFTLELTINFDLIESQFLVNSMVANCTAIDESGEVTLFKVHPGDPKRGVPGDPKRGVPGDPKRGVPGDPKRGVPGELLSPNTGAEIEFREEQRKTMEDLFKARGIKL